MKCHAQKECDEDLLPDAARSSSFADMAWTKPAYSHGQVNEAGKTLITSDDPDEIEKILVVINNWRASHGCPLQILKMTLLKRARAVYGQALIAQRIKRLPAIHLKLRTNPNMQLSRMHDIG